MAGGQRRGHARAGLLAPRTLERVDAEQRLGVEYLEPPEPIDAEAMPAEFSGSRVVRSLLVVAGLVAVVVAIIALVPGLGAVRERLAGAQPGWLALAAVLEVGSCAGYVLAFRAVFCRRMSWRTSTEIGLSELAANSLLSVGGAGGLALGAWILRRGGMPPGYIARRTVAFFLLTSLTNVGFLVLGGAALATRVLSGADEAWLGWIPALGALTAIGLVLAAGKLAAILARRRPAAKLARLARTVADGVGEARRLLRSGDPLLLAGTLGYMLFDVAMLGVCFAAFGNDVPPAGVLLVAYIIGQLGGLIPLPGGIGGVDGGLIGTLVLYGIEPADAAVAVLAYRALVLTIPAALGLPALAVLRRRLIAEAHDIAACAPGQEVEVLGAGLVQRPELRVRAS
jgi:uncharacterized membrane protein YbhN (UPF0104 family)